MSGESVVLPDNVVAAFRLPLEADDFQNLMGALMAAYPNDHLYAGGDADVLYVRKAQGETV